MSSDLPLYQKIIPKNKTQRALDVTILLLLLSLLFYRFLSFKRHGFAWFLAFLCESCFTFVWVLTTNTKWSPVSYNTYPQRLQERIKELPAVDIFVTTADPELEPPILTVNTVLSVLAVDYPAHKLACYVSDDGCSPLTFHSLVEASNFAKLWVPFCKKYNVQIRAPFRYFFGDSSEPPSATSSGEFYQDWKKMKEEYEQLCGNIEALETCSSSELTGQLDVFSDVERRNHPAIIKVIWENKERLSDGIPHLIYTSREKGPKHPHHYKAGAMNVLTRVSGVMTNAPFMLNVDCDMYANNPEIVLQVMCLFLGSNDQRDWGFVQCPQYFYDRPTDTLAIWHQSIWKGMVGIQGPFYAGSGTFHRRQVVYGLWPEEIELQSKYVNEVTGKIADDELLKKFGSSKEFMESADHALKGKTDFPSNLSKSLEAAQQVAACDYEYGSDWGKEIGWLYGSLTEDMITGIVIQAKGYRSGYCNPEPRAFLGCGPPGGPTAMSQQKRWSTGFLEILFSKNNPISASLTGKLQFRQCMAYLWILIWGLRSIPELCYAALPAYCIFTNSSFLPKNIYRNMHLYVKSVHCRVRGTRQLIVEFHVLDTLQKTMIDWFSFGRVWKTWNSTMCRFDIKDTSVHDPAICLPLSLFVIYNLFTLSEYIHIGFPIHSWWVNSCMARIFATNAWFFGLSNAILKLLGISDTVFEITQKYRPSATNSNGEDDDDDSKLTFDESPVFVPGTTILLLHIAALAMALLGLRPQGGGKDSSSGLGEFLCSVYVVLCFWPFLQGLFRKGKYGIPLSTICKSVALALCFCAIVCVR